MVPIQLNTTFVFIIGLTAILPVDIDGIHESISGSPLYGNNIISKAHVFVALRLEGSLTQGFVAPFCRLRLEEGMV